MTYLEFLRREKKLTRKKISEEIGCAESTIGAIELKEHLKGPNVGLVRELERFFNVPYRYLQMDARVAIKLLG